MVGTAPHPIGSVIQPITQEAMDVIAGVAFWTQIVLHLTRRAANLITVLNTSLSPIRTIHNASFLLNGFAKLSTMLHQMVATVVAALPTPIVTQL